MGNHSRGDRVMIFLALFAVAGMIGFLVFVQHVQQKEKEDIIKNGTKLEEENIMKQEENETKIGIEIIRANGRKLFLHNGGRSDMSLEGFRILLDGEEAFRFGTSDMIRAGENKECSLLDSPAPEEGTVVELYSEEVLLQKTVYSLLSGNREEFYFTIPSGFYSEAVTVEIVAPQGAEVHYTLDCSEPTQESAVYEGALTIDVQGGTPYFAAKEGISPVSRYVPPSVDKASVLTAVYIDASGKISNPIRAEYFIAFDARMAYTGLPVLSIAAQEEGLFGYFTGIYVSGRNYEDALAAASSDEKAANYYMGWEIPAYIQYYEADRGITYSGTAVLGIEDNGYADSLQKSFRLTVEETEVSKESSLYPFTNGMGESFVLETGQADAGVKIRDVLGAALLEDMSVITQDIQPCIVFLNGEYWGMYLMMQPFDASHIAGRYGIAEDEVLLNRDRGASDEEAALYEEMQSYIIENDMSVEENYAQAQVMVDMQNYIEYVCANIFLGNSDWPNGSQSAWRAREDLGEGCLDGRWRFVWKDAEQSMGNSALSSYSLNTYLRPMIMQDGMLYSLMRNAEFRERYTKTMKHMADTAFGEERAAEMIDEFVEKYGRAAVASYTRFQGNLDLNGYNTMVERVREFFEKRKEFILKYTTEFLEMERMYPLLNAEEETGGEEEPVP